MEFNSNKAIYLQISDIICEKILSGELKADDRIPSVREYGASIGVNPNTVMRTYEKLLKEPATFEGQAAARELPVLRENGEDGVTWSIVNDSSAGTLSAWGIAQPAAPVQPPDRGAGSGTPAAKPGRK